MKRRLYKHYKESLKKRDWLFKSCSDRRKGVFHAKKVTFYFLSSIFGKIAQKTIND